MDKYIDLIHWIFFASALFIAVTTEFIKRAFRLLPQNKWVKLFTPTRLFPAIFGGMIGLIPGIPAPEMVEGAWIGSFLYFATAGILSAWLYGLSRKIFTDFLPENIRKFIDRKLGKKESEET